MSKILCKPVVNLAFNETMSFEIKRMSFEGPLSGRVVRLYEIQLAKATNRQKNCSEEESVRSKTAYLSRHLN